MVDDVVVEVVVGIVVAVAVEAVGIAVVAAVVDIVAVVVGIEHLAAVVEIVAEAAVDIADTVDIVHHSINQEKERKTVINTMFSGKQLLKYHF